VLLAVALWLLHAPVAAVLLISAAMTAGTLFHLLWQHRQAKRARTRQREVANACRALAAQVQVGALPDEALRRAAVDFPILGEAVATSDLGGDPVVCWQRQGRSLGLGGLADLARTWQLCRRTGGSMARSLDTVSEALQADLELRLMVMNELAAPRATGRIMAVLPLCGTGLGYLIGGDPVHFLLSGPAGWGCWVAGIGLACLGVWWIDSLAARTERGLAA
jgi:tight adherence protein B